MPSCISTGILLARRTGYCMGLDSLADMWAQAVSHGGSKKLIQCSLGKAMTLVCSLWDR